MDKFDYALLTLVAPNWVSAPPNLAQPSPDLLFILKRLGQQGWEVVAIGDLGRSSQAEVLLKKRIP